MQLGQVLCAHCRIDELKIDTCSYIWSAGEESCIPMSSGYDMRSFTAVKGNLPPALPVKGKVTVVEKWATWCPPCRTSVPHLTSMQLEFPDDLHVVGITDEAEDKVRPFVEKMGNDMQYTVLRRNRGSEPPADFKSIKGIPHALLYGADGALKFQGHPLDPAFDQNLRKQLLSAAETRDAAAETRDAAAETPLRRAVFLQATDLPRMDSLSASDPFCAVFVRNRTSKNKSWAMCSFGPYFKKKKVHKGRDDGDEQDSGTIRNHMMATEVLRNCPDPVWSTPLIFDAADFVDGDDFGKLSDWEALFAVFDHVRALHPAPHPHHKTFFNRDLRTMTMPHRFGKTTVFFPTDVPFDSLPLSTT